MSKRILTFGALAAILVSAVVAVLVILDVVTLQDARESLGKTLSVILIVTAAVVVMAVVARMGKSS
jgi:hypothetical protein